MLKTELQNEVKRITDSIEKHRAAITEERKRLKAVQKLLKSLEDTDSEN